MGLLAGAIASRAPWAHEGMSLFLGVGFLGSFTTFSTFGLETVRLLQAGQVGLAATYVIASLVGGLAATWLGLRLA
jgi:CrcB protein